MVRERKKHVPGLFECYFLAKIRTILNGKLRILVGMGATLVSESPTRKTLGKICFRFKGGGKESACDRE